MALDFQKKKKIVIHWFVNELSVLERKAFLAELHLVSPSHICFAQLDFTRILPRYLNLRIFSLLDPLSLSRCAQVCWFWKYLTEADEIWKPKCDRLGWKPSSPQCAHPGSWKQSYKENVNNLRHVDLLVKPIQVQQVNHFPAFPLVFDEVKAEIVNILQEPPPPPVAPVTDTWQHFVDNRDEESPNRNPKPPLLAQPRESRSHESLPKSDNKPTNAAPSLAPTLRQRPSSAPRMKSAPAPPNQNNKNGWQPSQPWRTANRKPTDIRRFNYLDNEDRIIAARAKRHEQVARRSMMVPGTPSDSYDVRAATAKLNSTTGLVKYSDAENATTLVKPKVQPQPIGAAEKTKPVPSSVAGVALPPWLSKQPGEKDAAFISPVKANGRSRSHRDLPSAPLFPEEEPQQQQKPPLSSDAFVLVDGNRY